MPILEQMAEGQNNAHVVFNSVSETLEHQGVYGKARLTTGDLTWGYAGGRWGGFAVAAGTFTLTASTTNYIVVAMATGVPTSSTTSTNWDNLTDYARVYKLTTNATAVTASEDHRSGPGGVHGGSGAGTAVVADGDKGDVTVSASGTVWAIDNDVVTYAKMQNVSATDKLLGRSTAGAGDVEEIACTAAGRAILAAAGALSVAQGGSGVASLTAYAPVFGGTISTGAVQSGTAGTAGQVLTSNGAGVLPSFQALSAVSRVGMAFEKEFALSDLTTAITTGVTKGYWRPAFAATGVSARISLRVASSSGIPTVDMNKAGATMMSTKLTIDVSELTSVTAAAPVVMSTTSFAIDDLIEWDCDVAGTGAMGLVVTVTGLYA